MKTTNVLRMVGMAAIAVMVVVTVFASTVSAGTDVIQNSSQVPWRGSGWANGYIYAKAWSSATVPQPEMNVTSWLAQWEKHDGAYVWVLHSPSKTVSKTNTQLVEATAKVLHLDGGTFTTYSRHWGTFHVADPVLGATYDVYRYVQEESWP